MNESLHVLPINAPVRVGPHEAKVLRIQINPGGVVYEVGYWTGPAGGDWREIWVNAFMVEPLAPDRLKIGF